LKKISEKIAIPYKHFLKKDKSNVDKKLLQHFYQQPSVAFLAFQKGVATERTHTKKHSLN